VEAGVVVVVVVFVVVVVVVFVVVVVVVVGEEAGMDSGVPRKATLTLTVFADGRTSRRATKRSGRPQDGPPAASATTPRKMYLVPDASLTVRRSDARSCTAPPGPATSTARIDCCNGSRQARACTNTGIVA
jgi:hypothetical protein